MKKYYYCPKKGHYNEHFQIIEDGRCIAMWVHEDDCKYWFKVELLNDHDDEVYTHARELTEKQFKRLAFQKML